MSEEKIIKCEIQVDRIFFPKGRYEVESGEYAIFSANVVKEIENCNEITPTKWGDSKIKLKGNVCSMQSHVTYRVSCRLSERHDTFGDTYEIIFISKCIDLSNKSKQIDFL